MLLHDPKYPPPPSPSRKKNPNNNKQTEKKTNIFPQTIPRILALNDGQLTVVLYVKTVSGSTC